MNKIVKVLSVFVLTLAAAMLVACAPASAEKAVAKMEKAGYSATSTVYSEVGDNGEVALVAGAVKSDGNIISQIGSALDDNFSATLYDSSKNAKAAYNNTKDAEGNTSAVLVGKWVVTGSDAAIKAFKK